MNKMDIDEDSNLLIMGNCQEQFENIKDDFSEVSERNRIYNTIITDQHHSLVNPYLSPQPKVQEKTSRVIDQELLHSTVFKRNLPSESKIQLKTKLSFPQDSKFDTKDNAKLQQLDFTFYNQLALSDYQFQDIPFESKREYNGLETVQQKDSHGVKYIGQWKDGLLHGNGILISNTFKYIGQFKNGLKQFHGREIFTHQVYEGEFDAGRRKGRGVRYTEDYTQIGIFDGNIIYGIITYSNDDLYKGSLKNNRYDGIGFNVQQLQAGQIKQVQTQFKRIFHDQYLRRSFEKWQKQKKQNRDDGLGNKKYQKQTDTWYQNCHYDQGDLLYARVKYSNGNIYEGQLNNMSKHGKGKYLWKDGSTYEGQYFKDEKHGRGTLKTVLKIGSKIVEKQYRDRQFVNGVMKDQIQESVIEDQGSEIPNLWQ